jgi:hypothetical protein
MKKTIGMFVLLLIALSPMALVQAALQPVAQQGAQPVAVQTVSAVPVVVEEDEVQEEIEIERDVRKDVRRDWIPDGPLVKKPIPKSILQFADRYSIDHDALQDLMHDEADIPHADTQPLLLGNRDLSVALMGRQSMQPAQGFHNVMNVYRWDGILYKDWKPQASVEGLYQPLTNHAGAFMGYFVDVSGEQRSRWAVGLYGLIGEEPVFYLWEPGQPKTTIHGDAHVPFVGIK